MVALMIPTSESELRQDEEARFLAQVRAFFAEALTPDLREAGRNTLGVHSDMAACRIWYRRLYERGWIAPTWPKAYGGAAWSPRQRFLFDRESAINEAPVLFAGGLRSVGPLLIEMGTPHQKARFLPAILNGDDLWCQGFSEPDAGSDLAALRTRAERKGDVYIVNGAKIWTTGAHHANRMFAIVRTSDGPVRQKGLTFLLLDMDTPGLTVQPIPGISGEAELNHVFFDDVRVPVANRVGEEGEGWAVAKRLMQLARSNNTPAALVRRTLLKAQRLARQMQPLDPGVRARLVELDVELCAFEQLELAALPEGRIGAGDAALPSMLKLGGTELHQRAAELLMELNGPYAAGALCAIGVDGEDLDAGARAMAKHLAVRAATIYSGTSETQRNVIARSLGL